MIVESLVVGPLETNCYIVHNQREAIVIDPGDEPEKIEGKLKTFKVNAILITHGHFDHIMGSGYLSEKFNVPIYIMREDLELALKAKDFAFKYLGIKYEDQLKRFEFLKNGQEFELGEEILKVLHTPGHTSGSSCFLTDKFIFTGDTLFSGTIGRTDIGGSWDLMVETLRFLKSLNSNLIVYPGHGIYTTLGYEKVSNPFLIEI